MITTDEVYGAQGPEEQLTALLRLCGKFMYFHSRPGMQQGMVLQMLREGPLTQKQIQEQLGTQPGSVSELISKLEKKNLLQRQRSETDRRTVLLTLTERGADMARRHTGYPASGLYTALTEAEQETLIRLLNKLQSDWAERRV